MLLVFQFEMPKDIKNSCDISNQHILKKAIIKK